MWENNKTKDTAHANPVKCLNPVQLIFRMNDETQTYSKNPAVLLSSHNEKEW